MKTVPTPQGEVALLDPPVELLRTIRAFLPFGAVRYLPPQRGADFGLVMQCGDRALVAVKRQPVDCDEKSGQLMYLANETLIAHALASYQRHQFDGLFLPCAYLRQKEGGRVESGIACFGFPAPEGSECREPPSGFAFDQHLGRGFTTMLTAFLRALQEGSNESQIPLQRPIGLDVRSCLHLGTLGFGFMLVGPHIVSLKTEILDFDPAWAELRATRVARVFHLPSVPAAIREDQLPIAKAAERSDA